MINREYHQSSYLTRSHILDLSTHKKKWDAVVLVDACMTTSMDPCTDNCQLDVKVNCIHRFNKHVHVVSCNGFASFMRFTDSQTVLYFLWQLLKGDFNLDDEDCRYFIITQDKGFFRQTFKEWTRQKNQKTMPVMIFDDKTKEIKIWFDAEKTNGGVKRSRPHQVIFEIINVDFDARSTDDIARQKIIVDEINALISQEAQ